MDADAAGRAPADSHGSILGWLATLAGLIVLIVVVGGVTRLTESGLSITQWRPVSGVVPPLSEAEWQAEFAHYRQIDQYAAIHAGMGLAEFKRIFFWEYIHRVLARVIGLVAALGWLWFAARRRIPAGYGGRLLAVPLLIGLQGVLGWLMVASGLKPGMVEVAPGWLAAHLITALTALAYVVWTALDLARGPARPGRLALVAGAALALQLIYGALMAGLRAGLVTDQWPLMNGRVWPGPSHAGEGPLATLVADPAVVHFIHRWWAWVVVVLLVVMARRLRAAGARPASVAIHSAFGTQLLLGIATVMSGVSLWLAALHQLVGALLVVAVVWGAHCLGRAERAA
ncbi:MAG: COX15/CtaA family protein [Proteobacteria bacterium]|nr:COX15/CtaA family protein [Pseudomonadota bacterium]